MPLNKTFSLTYNEKLKLRSSIRFEALTFIIIAILGYLLSFKLTSYLADFKVLNHYSRVDIAFLAICVLLMYVPMSHISDAKKSKSENRNLAVWKPILNSKGEINYNFGRDYDEWFNDRFNGRCLLIALKSYFTTDKNQPKVIVGQDGWLFFSGENGVKNFLNLDLYTPEELKYVVNYLVQVNDYCKSRNKKFYYIIGPDKNKIYGEFYPAYYKQNIPNSQSRAKQLVDYLQKNTDVKVIYPYEELIEAKKKGDLLYWKHDTHWNSMGAYIGYKALINKMLEDGVDISLVKPEKFVVYKAGVKELDKMFVGRDYLVDDTEYLDAYISKNYDYYISGTTPDDIFSHNNMFTKKNIKAPRVVMFRDSFTRAMLPFIANTFSDVSYYWTFDVSKRLLEDADIVILENVERLLCYFHKRKFRD